MQIAIAIPTYKRPLQLRSFMDRHYAGLRKREIPIHVFHNEPSPVYSPSELDGVICYFSIHNLGITGNASRIAKTFADPNIFYIYTSDQEVIVWSQLDVLCSIVGSQKPNIVSFCRSGCTEAICGIKVEAFTNYSEWLCQVPYSETLFVYRGLRSSLTSTAFIGLDFFRYVPTHSAILHEVAVGRKFLGLKTNISVFKDDPLGSVTSGWTGWIPNIIICHVIFIKYGIYACSTTAFGSEYNASDTLVLKCIHGFILGFCNHLSLSVHRRMYSGTRVAGFADALLRKYPQAFTPLQVQQVQEFVRLNEQPLTGLSRDWFDIYSSYTDVRFLFFSMYPCWVM